MDSTLNYILKFNSNADKVTAQINKLDAGVNKINKHVKTMASSFSKGIDKINSKLGQVQLHSFIQNVQSAAMGLESLNDPGITLNESLADLSAITDVTGNKLKQIEGYARKSAKTFGGDAAAGVESYKLILSQLSPEIAKVPKALQGMGDHVAILSKTMGGDTQAATEVLTTAMNQYRVSLDDPIKASKEMSNMMNVMAAAAKEGSAELPAQKAALEQSGMAAKAAKVKFEETAAAIQVLDKAGKKGSEGGVALRNTLAVLSQGRFLPKDVQKELAAAGVDINTLSDKTISFTDRLRPLQKIMDDSALITKLFGKENSNAALALIQSIDEQERLTQAITGTNTAHEQAAIVMDSRIEKNKRLKARIDDFKISMFNATGGVIGYANVLGTLAFDISNLLPLFGGFGKALAFITNATKLQAFWTGVVSNATKVWTGVQWMLDAALSPIIIIPAIIIAVGAAIAWVISKTEGWGEAWEHTVNGGKLLFQLFGESIKLHFLTAVNVMMIGLNKIKEGWYKFKIAVGIGDNDENQRMLNKIGFDTVQRQMAIKNQAKQVAETMEKAKEEFSKAGSSVKWKVKAEADDSESEGILASFTPSIIPGKKLGKSGQNIAGSKTNKSVASGGRKVQSITINLKSLVDQLTIKGSDFKDTAKQMQDKTTDALLRTLTMAITANN